MLEEQLNLEYQKKANSDSSWIPDLKIEWFIELREKIRHEERKFQRLINKVTGVKPPYKEFDLEGLKNIPIYELIGKPIRESGDRASYRCPIHDEKTPSFVHYKKGNSFYCFGCGAGGSVIDLYMKLHGLDFIRACQELNKEYL